SRTNRQIVRVFVAIVFINTGMNENRVARLYARSSSGCPIGSRTRQVICAQQSFESRFQLLAFIPVRIYVKHTATLEWFWLWAGPNDHSFGGIPAIRIR